MANHFPATPAGWAISSLQYIAVQTGPPSFAAFKNLTGVTVNAATALGTSAAEGIINVTFAFNTPGNFGNFDQDNIESGLGSYLSLMAQGLAMAGAVTLAQAQAAIRVTRTWTLTGPAGWSTVSFTEVVPYP